LNTPARAASCALALFVILHAQARSQSATGLPSPGEYRIDSETSMTSSAGPVSTERVQRVDGATGHVTVINKSSLPGDVPVTTQYKGNGPVTWCVPVAASAPHALGVCDTTPLTSDAFGTSFSATCAGTKQDEHWRPLDKTTWEHDFVLVPRTSAVAPANSEVEKAMAPVYAEIEKTIRTGTPEEAASAREQLKALRAQTSVTAGAPPFVTRVHERWTRVSETCAPRR
jgi:hypothetical protein